MEDRRTEEGNLADRAGKMKDELVTTYNDFSERYDTTRDKVYAVNNNAIEFIQENPAVAIGVAVGIGYLVGRLASRRWLI